MSLDLTSLDAATLTLLAKAAAAAKSATRDALPVGDTAVDSTLTLTVTGTVRCGDDYTQRIVAKADPWTLLAVALSKLNGVTIDSLVSEALAADKATIKAIKAKAAEAIEAVKAPTTKDCKGKVTTTSLAVRATEVTDALAGTVTKAM